MPRNLQPLTYEFSWQPVDESEPPRSINAEPGDDEVQSGYLEDGKAYRFRLRAWGGGTDSAWTDYEVRTATADTVAPGVVTGPGLTGGVGQVSFAWTSPNSPNYFGARLYINTVNNFGTATLVGTEYGSPAALDARTVAGLTAGTKYGFIEAINGSGVPAAAVATGSAIVS